VHHRSVLPTDYAPPVESSFNTWLELVGWAGSALLIVSLLQARVLRFRVLNLAACLVLVAYNGLVGVWPMFGMNVVLCLINVWFIWRLAGTRHDESTYAVLEVPATDAYLQHFLRVHAGDIAKFHPVDPAVQPGDLAFQVLKGDETVGVVVIRRVGDVGQVVVDYVTPRFRDFAPGEFVWRTTRLHERGFRKVVTPADMVGAYYDRLGLGFRREDRSFVLDL
jgi:hypothetical protein